MMNQPQLIHRISKLSSEELLSEILELSQRERDLNLEILHYLRAIEGRRLYAQWGFSSLFEFATKKMGYSEGAAHRRISAMSLIKDVPQSESLLKEGELTLTTAAQLQTFFQAEEKREKPSTQKEKEAVINQVRNQSKRSTEKILAALAPEEPRPDKERRVSGTQTEIRLIANNELMAKLEKIRNLISESQPNATYQELMNVMADLTLKALRPKAPRGQSQNRDEAAIEAKPLPKPRRRGQRKPIPAQVKRQVWVRDQGCCTYQDPHSGRRCGSRYQVELDHRLPIAQGGESRIDNLRLLCKSHNLWEAVNCLGAEKMSRYIEVRSK